MHWRKKKGEPSATYEPLVEDQDVCTKAPCKKGYVPMLVGSDDKNAERFFVSIKLLKDPCILVLLDMAEREFGRRQEGILRLPCDAKYFRHVIDVISKRR